MYITASKNKTIAIETILSEVERLKSTTISWRRYFHEHPEPGLKEFETSKKIKEILKDSHIHFEEAGETGIIAFIGSTDSDTQIALRADMDALNLIEQNTIPYCSKNPGFMHACGHDGHIAILLTTAVILKKYEACLNTGITLIFQPAEENCLGANIILDYLSEKNITINEIFGLHLFTDLPCGKISIEEGPRMACTDRFHIHLFGKGGHAGKPHQCIDATIAGAALVMNLQSVISREFDPNSSVVLTIGHFQSGTTYNIISGEASIEGTVRSFSLEDSKKIEAAMLRITKSTSETYRCTYQFDYDGRLHPAVINNPAVTQKALYGAKKIFPEDTFIHVPKLLLGEDFSNYQKHIPGCFAFVGAGNPEINCTYPNHHPNFNLDENCLETGVKLMLSYALEH